MLLTKVLLKLDKRNTYKRTSFCAIEFLIIFNSVILIATFFAVIASKFIMENIFELVWVFDFKVLFNLGISIGLITLLLIMITNIRYLNPKVYPLIRNQ